MRLSLPNYTEILVPSRVGIQLSFHRINLPLNKTVIWKINLFDLIEIKYNLIQSVNRLLRSGNAPRASFGKISSAVKSWPLKNQSNWENITPRDATNRILTFKISNNVLGLLFPKFRLRNYCTISSLQNTFPGKFCPWIFRYLMRAPPEEFQIVLSLPKSLWRRNGKRFSS